MAAEDITETNFKRKLNKNIYRKRKIEVKKKKKKTVSDAYRKPVLLLLKGRKRYKIIEMLRNIYLISRHRSSWKNLILNTGPYLYDCLKKKKLKNIKYVILI